MDKVKFHLGISFKRTPENETAIKNNRPKTEFESIGEAVNYAIDWKNTSGKNTINDFKVLQGKETVLRFALKTFTTVTILENKKAVNPDSSPLQ